MTRMPADGAAWRRLRTILADALERPAAERDAFLERVCAGDAELRAQVETLIAADRRTDAELDAPVANAAAELIDELGRDVPAAEDPPAAQGYRGRRLGPYRVLRQIGHGGMGEVYEAFDQRLERPVAVKLLSPVWSRDLGAKERLIREARAVSAFDHPNICTVHDVGETHDGQLYVVMALYRGETLKHRLAGGPVPIHEAREIAIQIARGLGRAHEAGVTHRDVKPANVFLTERGQVKLLDFGIAKVAGASGLTQTGTSPGTPAYMSPEQARGEEVDARTDVWSLGVVLYEMVAGRRPFRGEPQALMHAILEHDPEPLAGVRPGVPAELERAVMRALAKDPAKRYPRVDELRADLEAETVRARTAGFPGWPRRSRRAAAAVVAVLLVAAGWWALRPTDVRRMGFPSVDAPAVVATAADDAEAVPVIGVVPLVNRTDDPSLDWIGAGIARLLSDDLSRSRYLHVVSERRLAAPADDGSDGGGELARRAAAAGIGTLISGEILPGSDGLTVAVRLDDLASGRRLTAHRVDGLGPGELLRAADELARAARKGLRVPPTEAVDVFATDFAADHPEAYERYLDGLRAFVDYRYDVAERAFTAALERAPDFTTARYRLAWVLAAVSRTDAALIEIRRALAEADRLPDREARYLRAGEAYIARRYDEAIEAYRRLIERYPYETEARLYLAQLLHARRRYDEELAVLRELAELEPDNHIPWSMRGEASLALGDYLDAARSLQRYVELEPENANGHHSLGNVYRAQGELELATEHYARALELDPAFHFATVDLAIVEVLRERPDLARQRLEALADDPTAAARFRIDAVFAVAALARADGRFRLAEETLARQEKLIAAEGVREAMALAERGASLMELDELEAAARLIDRSVERAPGVATRYLVARGLLELRQERFDAVAATIGEIARGHPSANGDRTREKAAAYLRGRWRLAEGRNDEAVDELLRAVLDDGYEYRSYRLGLARAYLAAERWREALAAAHQARERDPARPRLDLELDRHRALLVLARVYRNLDRPEEAAVAARAFLERWTEADPGLPELRVARSLTADP